MQWIYVFMCKNNSVVYKYFLLILVIICLLCPISFTKQLIMAAWDNQLWFQN